MKKLLKIFILSVLAFSVVACGPANTVFRPYTKIKQKVRDVQTVVTRADRSGVYVAIRNNTPADIEIAWNESYLGGVKVTQGAYVDRTAHGITKANTIMKPGEIYKTVLHRESDVYYLDPALYQPGGVKIKPLVYPTTLSLKIRQGNSQTDSITYIEHEKYSRKLIKSQEKMKELKNKDKYLYFYREKDKVYVDTMPKEDRDFLNQVLEDDHKNPTKYRGDKLIVK